MRTRSVLAAILAATLFLGAGSAAFARNGGAMFSNLPPEKQQAVAQIMKDADTRLLPLMEKMQAKRLELNALSRNPNVKPETLSSLAAEIAALGTSIRKERTDRNDKIAAETGMPAVMFGHRGGRMMHDGRMQDGMNCGSCPMAASQDMNKAAPVDAAPQAGHKF